MRDALKELQNTVRIGVITGGDRFERQVAENIARQACEEITRLRAEVKALKTALQMALDDWCDYAKPLDVPTGPEDRLREALGLPDNPKGGDDER